MSLKNCGVLLLVLLGCAGTVRSFCFPGSEQTGTSCNRYDMAVNKSARQNDEFTEMNAFLAVDGNLSTCSYTSLQAQPWWEVNFGQRFIVQGLVLDVPQDNLQNMGNLTVEVSDGTNRQMCHAQEPAPVTSTIYVQCDTSLTGDSLTITLHSIESNKVSLKLCNVGVYGDCVDGLYGDYCVKQCGDCVNATVCNKVNGYCSLGCDIGFKSPLCQEDCNYGYYGDGCLGVCGECKDNATCEVDDGTCLYGCAPGYEGADCKTQCKRGTFGVGCIDCGHCRYGVPCDFETGECPQRLTCNPINCASANCTNRRYCPDSFTCDAGWQDDNCSTECSSSRYGNDCLYSCGNCFNESCNSITGYCEQYCMPGYKKDRNCLTVCDEGYYGLECLETCGHCFNNSVCLPQSGRCVEGCVIGYQGTLCKDTCDPGYYSYNCAKKCGYCSNIACDATDGTCSGSCSPGYLGAECRQACSKGRYGQDCADFCPVNCQNDACNNVDGTCFCKPGWTGTKCDVECNYGPDCPNPCGNCNAGSACDRVDGTCSNGCADGFEGAQCLTVVVIERSVDKQFIAGMITLAVIIILIIIALVIWIIYRKKTGQKLEPNWMTTARSSIRRSFRRSLTRLSFRSRYQEHTDKNETGTEDVDGSGAAAAGKRHGRGYRRLYECVGVSSNVLPQEQFAKNYVQLQEYDPEGKAKFETAYQSFLRQRPTYDPVTQNGNSGKAYYNNAVHSDEIEVDIPSQPRVPAFLPLGSNLSGFFLINAGAQSDSVWGHLQQRQVETIVSIERESSVPFQAGERYDIGGFTIDCLEVHRNPCFIESKLTIRQRGTQGRRAIRHLETNLWANGRTFAAIPTFLIFIQRVQQLYQSRRERPVLICYKNLHEQAVLYCVCASLIELTRETSRVDVLRAVNSGGTVVGKIINSLEHFRYLHDVMFHTITMDTRNKTVGDGRQVTEQRPALVQR